MSTLDLPFSPSRDDFRRNAKVPEYGLRGRVFAGIAMAILLVGGIGGWAGTAKLSGAVISNGTVLVVDNIKVIQHREGGVVRAINVRKGQRVGLGDVLLRLDDVQVRTERSILVGQLAELVARQARLAAERDSAEAVSFPADYSERFPDAASIMAGEQELFESTTRNRHSQRAQLEAQIVQLNQEISGLHMQSEALGDEFDLAQQERDRMAQLTDRGLVETTRLNTADRELARMSGSKGELTAGIARANAHISELQLQILAVDEVASTDAQKELRTVATNIAELEDRLREVDDRLDRTLIRAPVPGTINELTVTTIGGVIGPAEKLMTIVPEGADLKIEFRVAVKDIDQIHVGQPAKLRFTAFNQRTTPEIEARVARVSAAAMTDPQSGTSFFTAEAEITGDLAVLGGRELVPGMAVDVFIQTQEQLAIAYFIKPFADQVVRAFREE